MLELTLNTPEQTAHLGQGLARALLRAPAVRLVLLRGELGCGKTTLTRALVAHLPGGALAEVASPSFTLCHCYPTTPPVLHGDLYRTPRALPEELLEALDALCAPEVAAAEAPLILIEWAEFLPAASLPQEFLDIHLQICQAGRLAVLQGHGEAARALVACLHKEGWAQA